MFETRRRTSVLDLKTHKEIRRSSQNQVSGEYMGIRGVFFVPRCQTIGLKSRIRVMTAYTLNQYNNDKGLDILPLTWY